MYSILYRCICRNLFFTLPYSILRGHVYIYLLYFSFIIGFETLSPGFIIGFETSELKKCWYRNSWLWFRKCFETSQL